jgi:hypothetical protein
MADQETFINYYLSAMMSPNDKAELCTALQKCFNGECIYLHFYGSGSNGKTTFVKFLEKIFYGECMYIPDPTKKAKSFFVG